MLNIKFKKLHPKAKCPTKNNFEDAGWDLYASKSKVLDPEMVTPVQTGIAIHIPKGYVGLIWDRSGNAIKRGIHRVAGVIDSGYIGEIIVGLSVLNDDVKEPIVYAGDKIAQLVIQEIPLHITWEEVDEFNETERGNKGFGSSGR